jgi:hypothetical protein
MLQDFDHLTDHLRSGFWWSNSDNNGKVHDKVPAHGLVRTGADTPRRATDQKVGFKSVKARCQQNELSQSEQLERD